MTNHRPLTVLEKRQIYQAKVDGKTIAEIAVMLGCSVACARKWWRCGRDYGLEGLQRRRRGRSQTGKLSQFDPQVATKALDFKQSYPKWGANRVILELEDTPELKGLPLPAASTLATYFKAVCPELLRRRRPKRSVPSQPTVAQGVHEIWQLDHQEGIRLEDGEVATICNVREPWAAAILTSRAFVVTTAKHWRKLTLAEVQAVLRRAFAEWQTMPHSVQTDNEPGLAGSPKDEFPSQLTLWLAGLGIKHQLIRPACPTDQAEVERTHQTMDGFAVHQLALANCETLQASLDKERRIHNERFPSRARHCHGLPPLAAHPQLHQHPRPYQLEREYDLFNLQYVADHLATYTFERQVSPSGQLSLGGISYYVGVKHKAVTAQVHFDAHSHQWLFTDKESGADLQRKPPKYFSVEYFTGLAKPAAPFQTAIQLSFPAFL